MWRRRAPAHRTRRGRDADAGAHTDAPRKPGGPGHGQHVRLHPQRGQTGGRFPIPPAPPHFQLGDWIDLDCTPRDADNRETSNHPSFAEWYPSSGGDGVLVENYDYILEDGASYNPQLQLRYLARRGYIDIYCKPPNTSIVSNSVRIEVRPVIE